MNRLVGALFIVISAASFGTLAILGRYAYDDGMDTFTVLALRFCLAALLMAGWLTVRRTGWPRGKTLAQLIGMGALGYVGQSFCYLTATQYASAGLVALLLYLYPTFVAILSVIFLKEKLTRLKVIALALATCGVALTADPQGGAWTGILLAISAAAIYSVYIIVGTGVLQRVNAIQSSTVIFASAGAVYATLAIINGPHLPRTAIRLERRCGDRAGGNRHSGGDLSGRSAPHRSHQCLAAFHTRTGSHGVAGRAIVW